MYRTGKSYLLNQMLLNRSKGFSVGPTINPCTKGLWIWNKPINGLDSNSTTKVPILLIDTEGFGAFDEDHNHDIKIFTLAVLLSSYFIYNSMGSIDETAIQSLSFVINLSKNIQLKGKYENDPEELSSLFPSFLWLVRDFSLQLVDDDGDTITPKEYLEKVLDTSKSTYEIDDKTKIRKLIKTYFRDRDCHTMVRPITDENKLQDLANISTDKLRPDFVEGIMQLRKKISSKLKPKTLHKKNLNGDMFINMIKSFIDAINKGAVPNIENTWTSMCKVECQKAFELSETVYEQYLKENLNDIAQSGSINTSEFIQGVYKVAKDNALTIFKKKCLGDNVEEYVKNLKKIFKDKLRIYEDQAEEINKREMFKKLKQFYDYFENKLYNPKSQDDEVSCEKIDEELKRMEYKINERFGEFKLKNELFNDFKANVFYLVGSYLKNNSSLVLEQIKNEKAEILRKQNEEIEEIKQNNLKELKKKTALIESMKTEILEAKEQNSELKHKLLSLEKDNEINSKSTNEKLFRIKDEYEKKIGDMQKIIITNDEKVREADRKVLQIENEKAKEVALLEQKNQYLTKQVEDLKKSGMDSGAELKSQLKESSNALKESSIKYENKIKSLSQTLDQVKESLVETEANCKRAEALLESEKDKVLEIEKKIKQEREENDIKINNLKKKYDLDKEKLSEELSTKEKDLERNFNKLKISYEELELRFKSMEDEYKLQISSLKRDNGILTQNNGFLEEKNRDLIKQMEEQKKNHDQIVARLESKTFSMIGSDEYNKKLDEIKNFYEKDKIHNEETYENQKKIYLKQIESLNEAKNEFEIKMKSELDDKDNKLNDLQAKLEKSLKDIKLLANEKKLLTDNLSDNNDEMNEKLKELLLENEKRIQEKEYVFQREKDELAQKSEDTIKQLKMIFETEKLRMEEKIKEEKNKADKKLKQQALENENKINELIEEHQNDRMEFEEQYKQLEEHNAELNEKLENIQSLYSKIESLEKSNKELKDNYNLAIANAAKANELAAEKFDKERKEFLDKIEGINSQLSAKDRENLMLVNEKEKYINVIKDKDVYVNNLRLEVEEEKKELQLKIEEYNNKYHEAHDKFLQEKMELSKDNAVLRQQVRYFYIA